MSRKGIMMMIIGTGFGFLSSCSRLHVPVGSITRDIKDPNPDEILSKRQGELLSKDELVALLHNQNSSTAVVEKANRLFSSPFVDNTAYEKFGIKKPTNHPKLGPSIRVTTWNIEKSIHVREVAEALKSEAYFSSQLKPKVAKDKKDRLKALQQREYIANSDILLFQEMDLGHCRSGYVFAAKLLAEKLGMNFVYAPQQLEIDPVYLSEDGVKFDNTATDEEACRVAEVDSAKYKGNFGVAVLSRYPIKKVQAYQLETQVYDWYEGEIQKPDFIEKSRRFGAERLFRVKPVREVKYGGRGFTRVDLHVPGVPHETITVINVHLEIKTQPKNRTKQMEEILNYLYEIENPVILAGDFNSSTTDVSSTSLRRLTVRNAKDPPKILSGALWLANATGISQALTILNGYKNFQDPLAWHIPVLFPNKAKTLFEEVECFRFKDGGVFDFRGDRKRSVGVRNGTLSNSNQYSYLKGFKQTFEVPKPIGPIGCERLDWIFVKSFLTHPKDKKGPYRLAPHFGETLNLMNDAVEQPFSDHHPITTVLPLNEPKL